MALDLPRLRAQYPALADGYAYLDGAAGTQMPFSVIDAIGECLPGRARQRRRRVPGQRAGRRDHGRSAAGRWPT